MAVAAGKAVLADAEKRYTAGAIPALEAAVEAQIADGSYDFELNLALLNLYQLHTDSAKEEVLVKVLAKARRLPAAESEPAVPPAHGVGVRATHEGAQT